MDPTGYIMHPYNVVVPISMSGNGNNLHLYWSQEAPVRWGMLQWPGHLNAAHGTQMGVNQWGYDTNCVIGKVQGTIAGWTVTHDFAHSYFTLMQTHNFSIQQIEEKYAFVDGWRPLASWELCFSRLKLLQKSFAHRSLPRPEGPLDDDWWLVEGNDANSWLVISAYGLWWLMLFDI